MAGRYDFHDEWDINAPLDKTWQAVSDSSAWKSWWPGLKSVNVIRKEPQMIGSSAVLTWRGSTGYSLTHKITITALKTGKLIEFTSEGDLSGYGGWSFADVSGGKTHMIIDWHVRTTKPWMNVLAVFLKPLFIYSHRLLMKRGEAGLNSYLQPKL